MNLLNNIWEWCAMQCAYVQMAYSEPIVKFIQYICRAVLWEHGNYEYENINVFEWNKNKLIMWHVLIISQGIDISIIEIWKIVVVQI